MRLRSIFTAAALVAGLAAPASAATNLLTNGSFESGSNPGSFSTISSGLPGWSILGNVDYIGSYWQASNGVRSIDLNGFFSQATLSQNVSGLTVGQRYIVSFDLAGNPDNGAEIKTLSVSAGGIAQNFAFNTAGASHAAMGWQAHSFSFLAGSASTTLALTSTTNNCCYGPALDNVSVSAVPEPSTWAMMLLGFAGLAYGARRRIARAG